MLMTKIGYNISATQLAAAYIEHIKDRELNGAATKGWINPIIEPGLLRFAVRQAEDRSGQPQALAVLARLICPKTSYDAADAVCGSGYAFDADGVLAGKAGISQVDTPDYVALKKISARRERKIREYLQASAPKLPNIHHGSEQLANEAEITAACAAMPNRPAPRVFALSEQACG